MSSSLKKACIALLLCLLTFPTLASSEAHAAPNVPSCNKDTGFTTTTITLPGGQKETWECDASLRSIRGYFEIFFAWHPLSINPSPSYWTNLNANLDLDVDHGSTGNVPAVLSIYNGQFSQQWRMDRSDTQGDFVIHNVNSGKCLGVSGGSTRQGVEVIQWNCDRTYNQTWSWVWNGSFTNDGWPIWNIINGDSGLCMGVGGGATNVGAHIVQWECNGHPDQSWY